MTDTRLFTGVANVAIPVTDQDRTKALLEAMGFDTLRDADPDGNRLYVMEPD
ncbi:MAG: hypothetical protein ACSLFP_17400 [Acidimicrobiales bacterium]